MVRHMRETTPSQVHTLDKQSCAACRGLPWYFLGQSNKAGSCLLRAPHHFHTGQCQRCPQRHKTCPCQAACGTNPVLHFFVGAPCALCSPAGRCKPTSSLRISSPPVRIFDWDCLHLDALGPNSLATECRDRLQTSNSDTDIVRLRITSCRR